MLGCSVHTWRLIKPETVLKTPPGEIAAVDCDVVWKLVFGRFPAELFNDHLLAHELLRFLRRNLDSLKFRVPQYTHFFPNLLKVNTKEMTVNVYTWEKT